MLIQFTAFSANTELLKEAYNHPTFFLNARQKCDLELLMNGGFAPLDGYLKQGDYESVIANCRLESGKLWPMPIVLAIPDSEIDKYRGQEKMTLMDELHNPLAILHIEDIYKPDLEKECLGVFGSTDTNHPYVNILLSNPDVHYVGGRVDMIQLPLHFDFQEIRFTPEQTKTFFKENNWETVVGFQTRNPMHKSHIALTQNSAKEADPNGNAKVLLQPVVGVTQPGDVDYHTRVRCYKKLLKYYPEGSVQLCLLPLSMRMGGPREALWHALIRQNYGCTHFVVGRDHAGPSKKTKEGNSFYGPYDAHELIESVQNELTIKIVKSKEIVYVEDLDKHMPINEVPDGAKILRLSGTQFRKMLTEELEIPSWFSYPDILTELRQSYQKNHGFCLYFTGLSGAGKTTLAQAVKERLMAEDHLKRKITYVDADEIRRHLSKGLGFSPQDRSTNVRRIGYVASLVVKNGGVCVVANIAPYKTDRDFNRDMIAQYGPYVEVFVNTPLEVCETRDIKGLYKAAREGKIKQFTGISDPYDAPADAEIVVDGSADLNECVDHVMNKLRDIVEL